MYGEYDYINVDDVWFTPHQTQTGSTLRGFDLNTFYEEKSPIFKETKHVYWTSEVWQSDRDAEKKYEERSAPSYNTVYYFFPGPSIVFLIPLLVVGFKSMSPWFKFFRFASWIIIFPSALILSLILLL